MLLMFYSQLPCGPLSSGFLTKNMYTFLISHDVYMSFLYQQFFLININSVRQTEQTVELLIICLPSCRYFIFVMFKPHSFCNDSVLIAGIWH